MAFGIQTAIDGIFGGVSDALGTGFRNLVSGGTWTQSGQELAQQAYNSSEAQKQRDYATEMSNTAYQRAVKDMSSAGLNPYLAYQQGGASTPSGSSASTSYGQSNARDLGSSVRNTRNSMVNNALDVARLVLISDKESKKK